MRSPVALGALGLLALAGACTGGCHGASQVPIDVEVVDAVSCAGPACVAVAPRPVAPISASRVTSFSPALRWQLAPGTDGARVQICADRPCGHVLEAFDVKGQLAAPPSPLAPGVKFWRLFSRQGSLLGTTPSPTWEFVVRQHEGSVSTAWGTIQDVNGDGFADEVGGSLSDRNWGLYPGSAAGIATTPAQVNHYMSTPWPTPDLNGDGFPDIVDEGFRVEFGGPSGFPPSVSQQVPVAGASAVIGFRPVGDVNQDGYGDAMVNGPGSGVSLVFGSAGGLTTAGIQTIQPPIGAFGGYWIYALGDVNGDGYADVGVEPNTTYLLVYLGGASGLVEPPVVTLGGPSSSNTPDGFEIYGGGDFNGDGYADIVFTEGSFPPTTLADAGCGDAGPGGSFIQLPWPVYIFDGGPEGPKDSPAQKLPAIYNTYFASDGLVLRDVNGDGYDDLLLDDPVLSPCVDTAAAGTYEYLGGPGGLTPAGRVENNPNCGSSNAPGDVNGDGFDDVLVGGCSAFASSQLFYGSPSGLTTAGATLTPP